MPNGRPGILREINRRRRALLMQLAAAAQDDEVGPYRQ
jgi:hypothetical protein